jgi:hypothetical protein
VAKPRGRSRGLHGPMAAPGSTLPPSLPAPPDAHRPLPSACYARTDLTNMAYDVEKLDPEVLRSRHHLQLVTTSFAAACQLQPGADPASPAHPTSPALASSAPASATRAPALGASAKVAHAAHKPLASASASASAFAAAATADAPAAPHGPSVVSFSRDGPGRLSPGISLLSLTSPEAVTAALTSAGHGAAFANPVYVTSLHPAARAAMVSLGSWDEEGDIQVGLLD